MLSCIEDQYLYLTDYLQLSVAIEYVTSRVNFAFSATLYPYLPTLKRYFDTIFI